MSNKVIKKLSTPRAVKWFWIIITAPVAVILFLLLLIAIGTFGKLPTFEELENPKSNLATEVFSDDGEVLGSFFVQNRSFIDYENLSPNLIAALVSTEDKRFYSHSGVDFIGLVRVVVRTVGMGQGQGGGSTISQQVAKNLYPRDTTLNNNSFTKFPKLAVAKLKEWITAVMLEHNYTKDEIVAMYFNTMEYGSNAWGIKSAAKTFFNKSPDEVNVQEAAMLVGVVNAPTRFSPVRNPQRALGRRNTVIARMKNMGYINSAQRDSICALPIELDYQPISHTQGTGTYFRAMINRVMTMQRPTRGMFLEEWNYNQAVKEWDENPIYGWTIKNVKSDGTRYDIYRDGLKIHTTLNARMQRYAEESMIEWMSSDKIQGDMDRQVKRLKRTFLNVNQKVIDNIMLSAIKQSDRYRNMMREGVSEDAILKTFQEPTELQIFSYKGDIDTIMTPYDSILYHKQIMRCAMVAVDPSSGYVRAYIGGPDFTYFKYDNAMQARRQIGSTMKPFIYTYAFDQLRISPETPVANIQYMIETASGEVWQPKEAGRVSYDENDFRPLKYGLIASRNNYTAWIMKQSMQPQAIADYIHRFGIKSYIYPSESIVLGAADLSPFELTGAFGTFVNRGEFIDPIFITRIEDRYGNVLEYFTPKSSVAVNEKATSQTLEILRSVVSGGTAHRLNGMIGGDRVTDIAGKTGTTNLNSDAWFVGLIPKLVIGTWIGGEDRSVHFMYGGEGGLKAMPMCGMFMKRVYADPSLGITKTDKFHPFVGGMSYSTYTAPDNTTGIREEDEFFD